MDKYEYKVVEHTYGLQDAGLEEQNLNFLASDRWELACVAFGYQQDASRPLTKLYFKRPIVTSS